MRKKEQRLWDTMKRNKPRAFWLQRVENVVGVGMPDVYSVGPGQGAAWVELKAITRPKRETTRLLGREGLNPDQINWHLKAGTKGLRSYVLIRDNHGELYLVSGAHHADKINDWPRSEVIKHSLGNDWIQIFGRLA